MDFSSSQAVKALQSGVLKEVGMPLLSLLQEQCVFTNKGIWQERKIYLNC